MSQDNQITLRGFVTAEPKFRQTAATATPFTEIRVGSTPSRLNRETGEWQELPTTYYRVKCWRRLAINTSSSLKKGDMVVVRGRFTIRTWTDSQQRLRETVEIEADSVGHDLAYGWSHFLRGTQVRPGDRAALDGGEAARQDLEMPEDADGADGPDGDGYPVADGWTESDREDAIPVTDSADDDTRATGPGTDSDSFRGDSERQPDAVAF
jgi:single-strand DNA-binding protein